MDKTIFSQSIARVRSLETKMFDRAKLEALTESAGFSDTVGMLQDSQYGEYLNMPSYEEGLKLSLQKFYKEMYKITPVKEVIDILAMKYDGHNIKSLIKGKFLDIEVDKLLIDAGTIPLDSLKTMIKEENFRDMPMTLRINVEKALEVYKNTSDPQEIDINVDKGIFSLILEVAKNSELDYLLNISKLMVDIVNLKAYVRIKVQDRGREFFKKVYIPGGNLDLDLFINNMNDSIENFPNKIYHTDHYKWLKEGLQEYFKTKDLGKIEKYGDNYLTGYLKKAKLVSFGPEPLIAFTISRENELKAIRIILTGKKNMVEPDIIRERLRDVYV